MTNAITPAVEMSQARRRMNRRLGEEFSLAGITAGLSLVFGRSLSLKNKMVIAGTHDMKHRSEEIAARSRSAVEPSAN
jgi:hypothetical protein